MFVKQNISVAIMLANSSNILFMMFWKHKTSSFFHEKHPKKSFYLQRRKTASSYSCSLVNSEYRIPSSFHFRVKNNACKRNNHITKSTMYTQLQSLILEPNPGMRKMSSAIIVSEKCQIRNNLIGNFNRIEAQRFQKCIKIIKSDKMQTKNINIVTRRWTEGLTNWPFTYSLQSA